MIYGYGVIKDGPYIPWFMGGSGSWAGIHNNVPFTPVPEGVPDYYCFELGYLVGGMVEHMLFDEYTNDFVMYMLHHVCAVMLTTSSFLTNFLGLGCIYLFPIDIGDIFTNSASGFGQTTFDKLAALNFFTLMAVWIYTRLIIAPWILYKMVTDFRMEEPFYSEGLNRICYMNEFMIGLLVIMNYVWFYMFTQIAKRYIVAGETEDLVGNLKKR